MTAPPPFSYDEFTARNLGFVSEAEQRRLQAVRVFVCGAGGMGGAALQSLIRAGVGHVAVADPDCFELSNLNRQVFASLDTLGRRKVDAVHAAARAINPELELETYGAEWTGAAYGLLERYPIVINAMDDIPAGVLLYRKARERGATVIDAYTSPLPSVTVVRPAAPRPEERLGYPTVGKAIEAMTPEDAAHCLRRELEYVLVHSSSARHIDLALARDFLLGRRKRPSFAPMVITTGNLMCFETVKLVLERGTPTDERGYFFNPWDGTVERPRRGLRAFVARRAVRRWIRELGGDA
ncbi:MAG: ThiF family adenylyltransferase [Gemmatimonadetes bacterium]|nr:MAG: thiamine biosynthesis protein ThiF [Gemmatimonadota bacterium]TLY55453.1 MAG: ThiF family adenylyltransferase [Gemmatimonadota bacterium]